MRRLFMAAGALLLFFSTSWGLTPQEEQEIVEQTLAAYGKFPFAFPDTVPVHRLCGTGIIMGTKHRLSELSPASRARLQGVLGTRPSLPQFFDAPLLSGQSGPGFRIHYAVTGSDSVRNSSVDLAGFNSSTPNGIPDWVDTIGLVLDSIWMREVDQLGFRAPLSDAACPTGDGPRFDVYLQDIASLYLGYTDADDNVCYQGNRVTAFIGLDNDYANVSGYPEPDGPRRVLRVTAAHEFFHAVQYSYTAFNFEVVGGQAKPYWYEASAVWMEEQVYNEINDYVQYLPFWFDRPELSFRTYQDLGGDLYHVLRPYALGIYGIYLSKRFPSPSYGYSVVRRVWERMATVTGFNLFTALDYALGSEGSNFLASLREFYQWNYFVANNRPLNASFYSPEDSIWPTFAQYDQIDSTTAYPTQFPEIHSPCGSCDPDSVAFFCAPCNLIGPPCETQCPPSCRFVPYQPTDISIINCITDLEDLGASYLNLKNPGGGSFVEFALLSDTGRPAPWFAAAAGYHANKRTYTFLAGQATDPTGRIPEIFFSDFGNYTEIVVMVMNDELLAAGLSRQSSTYAYSVNVDSTAPPSATSIQDVRPNPFRPEIDQYARFPVVLDSLSGIWEISLIVFSPAGEVVCRKNYELSGGFTYNETVVWYGKNGDDIGDAPVASGVYFCKIVMNEKGTSRKVEKVSRVALIRQ